ncbi:hypothetical protein CPC08DRAFT_726467 [Agrocybe pediades]|nr:hypothetical protein CPC08DRAFT_726467 [Agrocybe pediades]
MADPAVADPDATAVHMPDAATLAAAAVDASTQKWKADHHPHQFPPFPSPPEGVTITPFSAFIEHGIQIFTDPETGVEIDGLGIPTVRLRTPHATDARKTQAPKGAKPRTIENEEDGENEDDADDDDEGEAGGEKTGGAGKKKNKKKKKKKKGPRTDKQLNSFDLPPLTSIKDPVERAEEQKRRRLVMFAQREWWELWAEGEELRRGKIYDTNLPAIDRIHMAATEFRVGRTWPPGSSRLKFLWDQFRLYVGLLGSTPVWLPMYGDDASTVKDDDDESSDATIGTPAKTSSPTKKKAIHLSDSEDEFLNAKYSDEEEEEEPSISKSTDNKSKNVPKGKPKRILPRTPYGLFDVTPIPVTSPAQTTLLLSIAAARRNQKLFAFLEAPANHIAIFLSSYMQVQALNLSPLHLTSLPRLVCFYLEFLVRAKVLPESERDLRKAIEIAKKAVYELPKIGWVCKTLPEVVGVGAKAIWGTRWVSQQWSFDYDAVLREIKEKEELEKTLLGEEPEPDSDGLKEFEEELKAADVEILPADPEILGGIDEEEEEEESGGLDEESSSVPTLVSEESSATIVEVADSEEIKADDQGTPVIEVDPADPQSAAPRTYDNMKIQIISPSEPEPIESEDEDENKDRYGQEIEAVDRKDNAAPADIGIEVMSPTSPRFVEPDEDEPPASLAAGFASPSPSFPTVVSSESSQPSAVTSEAGPSSSTVQTGPYDWSNTTSVDAFAQAEDRVAHGDAWSDPTEQPLMQILGMTNFPIAFEAGGHDSLVGVAERSMRRIKSISKPAELNSWEKARDARRALRGKNRRKSRREVVEEELTANFARVVLSPWLDWPDAGVGGSYVKPKVQGPAPVEKKETGEEEEGEGDAGDELEKRRKWFEHDAEKDDIVLLLESRIADALTVGMGLAGTWVQLVPTPEERQDRDGSSGSRGRSCGRGRGRGRGRGGPNTGGRGGAPSSAMSEASPAANDKDSPEEKEKNKDLTYWYMEDVYMVIPSFWTVNEEEEEDLRTAFENALAERGENGGFLFEDGLPDMSIDEATVEDED